MAHKYGLFTGPKRMPDQEFEGDYMTQNGEYVMIFKRSNDATVRDDQVAAVRLEKGQAVRQIS